MLIVTMLPTYRNDGSPVSQAEMDSILEGLWLRFGGLTIEGIVEGHWVDNGTHYQDKNLKVSLAIEPERIDDVKDAVRAIGRQLDQEAMYLEVSRNEVLFLKP